MLKAMMIIAMLGGVDMHERSEYSSMQECKKSKQVILKQDADAKVFCVPMGKPTGMANVEALFDRFLLFIRELNDMEAMKESTSTILNSTDNSTVLNSLTSTDNNSVNMFSNEREIRWKSKGGWQAIN